MRKKDLVKSLGDLSLLPAAIMLAQQASREYGQWEEFIAVHFRGPMRTAQKYMRLARNWQMLAAENPTALSSQKQPVKALTAIGAPGDAQGAQDKSAQGVRVWRKTRAARGPVWRAAGPLVREAMNLLSTLEASLSGLVARGYRVGPHGAALHALSHGTCPQVGSMRRACRFEAQAAIVAPGLLCPYLRPICDVDEYVDHLGPSKYDQRLSAVQYHQ